VQFSFSVDSLYLHGYEQWDAYLNGQLVGSDICSGCAGGSGSYTFADSFAPIVGNGTYTLEFLLVGGVAPGYGSIVFNDNGSAVLTGVAVPGPIVGSGLPGLIFAGGGLLAWWRRKRKAQAVA
jgi:hypothetical protein